MAQHFADLSFDMVDTLDADGKVRPILRHTDPRQVRGRLSAKSRVAARHKARRFEMGVANVRGHPILQIGVEFGPRAGWL